ncbi:hypothetical protein GPECTOR_1g866 [Gonium pectorale]|uniref:Uncharacterized protein n=1 Tax=Gonium pectorale TaxID=33097 RepID=A0A150H5Q3_GONPE|nr:hypothetical protein GPECTOR_1g866 [Gonium pectorale]|eukprot:KXZ56960.1 hypothetical protein GPECTOR_1g866 [Gonium pectorale]
MLIFITRTSVGLGEGFSSNGNTGNLRSTGLTVYYSEYSYCYEESGYATSTYDYFAGDKQAPDARGLGLTVLSIPPSAEVVRVEGNVSLTVCNYEQSVCKTANVIFNLDTKCPTSPYGGRSFSTYNYPSTGTTYRSRSNGNQCVPDDGQAFPPSALQLTLDGAPLPAVPYSTYNAFSYSSYSSTTLTTRT